MNPRTVVLSGRSLLLSLVATSLEQSPVLHVVLVSTWGEVKSLVGNGMLDVIICDLADASELRILPLLSENPGLLLIGLDGEHNRAVLLAGKETRALTLERVKDIVEGADPDALAESKLSGNTLDTPAV